MEPNQYYRQVSLQAGQLHVYAGPSIFEALDYKVFEMANRNLQIPHRQYMSYTPDVHVGVGTCIGTWEEVHEGESCFVHRKGATMALPPGHQDNPQPYAETGHPALIPGSMGTASYIMAGLPGGRDNYYSICHGAGRVRSRSATKRIVTADEFAASLRIGTEEEIVVNQRSLESILDESPQAYKDVDQIIESVVGAGLARVVAKCKPLAAVKGA